MTTKTTHRRSRGAAGLIAAAAAFLIGAGGLAPTPSSASANDNLFAELVGNWNGSGTVTYASGTTERLRCKVKYDQQLQESIVQTLRCASDSYKFQINAYYRNASGNLTGHWDELTLQISGSISGSVSQGKITGSLHGPGFLASVLVDTKGNQQTVNIAAENQDIRQVSIQVSRN
jgi:hypothetical protein